MTTDSIILSICPAGIYPLKVKLRCEICSKLKIKTPERRQLTNFTPCSSVSIVNFEHVIAGWV